MMEEEEEINNTANMDKVANAIVGLLNDPTIRPEALAIAQFMLHTERLNVSQILQQLAKPGARDFVEKLLNCESEILSPTPRSLGIDITSFISADKIQKSLDVKHLHLAVGSKKLDRIIPNIKQAILYSHPTNIWIRFYSESNFFRDISDEDDDDDDDDDDEEEDDDDDDNEEKNEEEDDNNNSKIEDNNNNTYDETKKQDRNERISKKRAEQQLKRQHRLSLEEQLKTIFNDPNAAVVRVCNHIYELYLDKRSIGELDSILIRLEETYGVHLIFCSELAHFSYNKLLFLSNYVKFVWCYALNREHFDPRSMADIKAMIIYLTYGLLFLDCTNLTNMPQYTHNPLIAYTGERPKISMAKFNRNSIFTAEGTRAMLTMNGSSDFGTKSNYIEVTSTVEIPDNCIDDIL
nr:OrNV p47-like [Apis mellifera nudivirus]